MHRFVIALSFGVVSACGASAHPTEPTTPLVCRDEATRSRLQPTVCPVLEQLIAMAERDLRCDSIELGIIGTDWGQLVGPIHLSGCGRSIEYVQWQDRWVTRDARDRLSADASRSAP